MHRANQHAIQDQSKTYKLYACGKSSLDLLQAVLVAFQPGNTGHGGRWSARGGGVFYSHAVYLGYTGIFDFRSTVFAQFSPKQRLRSLLQRLEALGLSKSLSFSEQFQEFLYVFRIVVS